MLHWNTFSEVKLCQKVDFKHQNQSDALKLLHKNAKKQTGHKNTKQKSAKSSKLKAHSAICLPRKKHG
jgi:hypothetical protein